MKKTECVELEAGLKVMQFENAGSRSGVMRIERARAFIKTALARGQHPGRRPSGPNFEIEGQEDW
jgi:hypothetical protein